MLRLKLLTLSGFFVKNASRNIINLLTPTSLPTFY
jgi:hypothetical protein